MAISALPVDQRIIDIDSRRFASIEKALVELITNCDDSYSRLEQRGTAVSGVITISYERHQFGAVLTVTDTSEGMPLDRLRSVLSYGGAHSELSQGESRGRGYFGRGLKQAVYGLGHGWIESVHEGQFSRVDLFRTDQGSYVYDDYDGDRPVEAADHDRLQIPQGRNGTRVTIIVDNPQVTLPYFRSLATAISNNIYLRDILKRRQVELVNQNLSRQAAVPMVLQYPEPASDLLIGPDAWEQFIYQGTQYHFLLTLRKATSAELILKGDERSNGLLVMSGTAVLDCQFFRFENQLGTEYLFGTVVCPGLLTMLASGHPVISDEREGLNLKEPFVVAFANAVSDVIAPVIEHERLRLSHVDHASTSKRTQGLIEQVLKEMNKVAVTDLGIILPPGPGVGQYGPFQTGRPAVLRFSVPFYFRKVGHSFHVTAIVDRNQLLNEDLLTFDYALPDSITVDPELRAIAVGELPEDGQFVWALNGAEIGAKGKITVASGPYSAACEIVIAERAGHGNPGSPPSPGPVHPAARWDQDNSTDMFVGYALRNLANDIDRAVYDAKERLILVNTEAPTVRLYIDGQGRFRDGARLLLAELFLDVIAGELARHYVDRSMQKGDSDAYWQAKQTFVRRYGLDIHRIMMGE